VQIVKRAPGGNGDPSFLSKIKNQKVNEEKKIIGRGPDGNGTLGPGGREVEKSEKMR